MSGFNRRRFLKGSLITAVAPWHLASSLRQGKANEIKTRNLRVAPFRFDITPPMGHPCCGGWIKPVVAVDDSLEAIGLVFFGYGKPIVLCAVDWTGLLNAAHIQWREALAAAAHTTPDRVAVQCVHQHNAPFACLDAQRLVAAQADVSDIVDVKFFQRCLDRGRQAVLQAITNSRPVTHVAHGQAKVEQVASNRRVFRDEQGNLRAMRGSSCTNPELRALPEGLIDPWLKTVAFYDGDRKLAACHYYATHPMSYYGDGRVTSDFAGLARKQRQLDEPDCTHLYFTGCAGNIAAGKYNDGSPSARPQLTRRLYDGIRRSEESLSPLPIEQVEWRTIDIQPPLRETLIVNDLLQQIADPDQPAAHRGRAAYKLAFVRRVELQIPIVLSAMAINDVRLLHLPGECFVQYQLRAQKLLPTGFVATAAYGDGGPWYIPVKDEYSRGGYAPSVAFCSPTIDEMLTESMRRLL